jgi:pimeloyl-ACP methyl ester carboxylesterase
VSQQARHGGISIVRAATSTWPVAWSRDDHRLRGMLFLPKQPPTDLVVICSPFWEEGECSHRAMVGLASYLATEGVAALRFDYTGCGESEGHDFEGRWSRYGTDVLSAVDFGSRVLPCARITVMGVRLGANLLTSLDLHAASGIVLAEPVLDGPKHWRDLELATLLTCPGVDVKRVYEDRATGSGYLVRQGHRVHPSFREHVSDPSWPRPGGHLLPPVLLLSLHNTASGGAWDRFVERLKSVSTGVTHAREPAPRFWRSHDLDRLDLEGCEGLYRCVLEWIAARRQHYQILGSTKPSDYPSAIIARSAPDHEEGRVFFVNTSIGAVCISVEESLTRVNGLESTAVVLLPAPPQDRAGPQRLLYLLSASLAEAGFSCYRLDPPGCGDSDGRSAEQAFFADDNAEYVDQCLDAMRQRGHTRLLLVGLCTGATAASVVALRREEVRGVAMLNAYRGEPGSWRRIAGSSVRRWLRTAFRGVGPVTAIKLFGLGSLLHRLGLPGPGRHRWGARCESVETGEPNSPTEALRRISCPLLIVYGSLSRYADAFEQQLTSGVLRFLRTKPSTAIRWIPDGTDAFHSPESRGALSSVLAEWCLGVALPAGTEECRRRARGDIDATAG